MITLVSMLVFILALFAWGFAGAFVASAVYYAAVGDMTAAFVCIACAGCAWLLQERQEPRNKRAKS